MAALLVLTAFIVGSMGQGGPLTSVMSLCVTLVSPFVRLELTSEQREREKS